MNKSTIIDKTADYIKSKMSGEGSGHDWWHVYRVWQLAKHIGKDEHADLFIVELSALLHDIADWKFQDHHDPLAGGKAATEWLTSLTVDQPTIYKVCEIVNNVSFKGAGVGDNLTTIEGQVVQDADRLDAIGAIGIGRVFTFGGAKSYPMYDPAQKPTPEDFGRRLSKTSINHFYEKLLLLKDRMHTKTAKNLADNRHKFMETFLTEFFQEWDGGI